MLVPGEATPPIPSFSSLPMVLCVRLSLHGLFSVQFGMSIGTILVQLMFGQSVMFVHVASDVTRRHSQKIS